ncbi:MAG: NFACT family protein [Nitrospirota bacterium]|nr:MAG: NFACT family protein [Nitrospirota bacterium]
MNLTELEAVLEELHPNCVGGWIQKIHQPLPNTFTFDIRVPGKTMNLLICADPRYARIHFASIKSENPQTPPPFCQFLRAHLEGGRIEGVAQEPQDRVVYLTITTASTKYILVVALTGNQSNLYLLNESKQVLQTLKDSWVKIGDLYAPPTQDKRVPRPLARLTLSPFQHDVEGKFSGHSGTLAPPPSPQPSPLRGEGALDERRRGEFAVRYPVSAEIEDRYWKEEQVHILSQLRNAHLSRIKKALKHTNKKIKKLQEDLKKAERYREYGRYGELLKGQLHSIAKGQEAVTVVDYYDPSLPQLTLPLDTSKDPVWNMEDYFKKHHKFLSAEKHLQPRLETAKRDLVRLQEELATIESGENLRIQGITQPSQGKGKREAMSPGKPPKPQPARSIGYRQFVSADGLPLLVGKTAKDNDFLTFKVAGPDDLWLHARGTPGSHVVIRLEKGAETPHETLKDAATLALWFSDLRKSGKGEVIYTHRKFVKKAKGQKAGSVTVSREKSIWIECKEERLDRLKWTAR